MVEEERPTKRIKIDEHPKSTKDRKPPATTVGTTSISSDETAFCDSGQKNSSPSNIRRKGKYNQLSQAPKLRAPKVPRTFSQPSVICSGDRGVFVTCDKGREQKSLLELHDLIQQYLEEVGLNASGVPTDQEKSSAAEQLGEIRPADTLGRTGIEADIASELAQLKNNDSQQESSMHAPKPIQLITLDIPCVSFLRLPPGSTLDPVDIVHKLCLSAAVPASPQKSRYIKRLTPISNLAKALSQGLEKICEDVLPKHFGPGEDERVISTTFAIRPSIRNNDKLDRDAVIKLVATHVQDIGNGQHKVDLKYYKKGVLVEVYRGWVGICVVDNTGTGPYEKGYEGLKRFNLAEIYANR